MTTQQGSGDIADTNTKECVEEIKECTNTKSNNENERKTEDISEKHNSECLNMNKKYVDKIKIEKDINLSNILKENLCKGVKIDGNQLNNKPEATNKLNVHAKEFTMTKPNELINTRSSVILNHLYNNPGGIHQSKPLGNIQQQLGDRQQTPRGRPLLNAMYSSHHALPILTLPSSSKILHNASRVHFKLPQQYVNSLSFASMTYEKNKSMIQQNGIDKNKHGITHQLLHPPLMKRSKSFATADIAASGMVNFGQYRGKTDLGIFSKEVQEVVDKAINDPNQLPARDLIELAGQVLYRAVENPRYALPAAHTCITIIEKEHTPTFFESLLNICQQWYKERDKVPNSMIGDGHPYLMAFILFLLELYCRLRKLYSTNNSVTSGGDGNNCNNQSSTVSPPARALLILICKCCEVCIRAPALSASDIENLIFIFTYIGQDLETQLPFDLKKLLSVVRDVFINTSAVDPFISQMLLQLIELHASDWRLPEEAILYYYPSDK